MKGRVAKSKLTAELVSGTSMKQDGSLSVNAAGL